MSATIQLSGTESEHRVREAKSGQNVGNQSVDRGDQEYQVKKGNENMRVIQESVQGNEK